MPPSAPPTGGLESARDLQARFIASETPKSLLIGLASAWLLAAGMWGGQPDGPAAVRCFGWAGVISLLLLRGCRIAARVRVAEAGQIEHLSRRLRFNAALLACLWGASAFLMLPGSDLEHQMLLVAAIALITMGGAVGRAVHDQQVAWFVMITSGLFAAGLLSRPGRFQLFIGLGYLLFGTVVALFTRAQVNTLQRERDLALQLERARIDAEAARSAAERASAAKTRFLAAASHDLRQPMHAIGLLVGLLKERANAPMEVEALAHKAQQSVHLMEDLFGSLLDISKLDAGAVQPDRTAVSLHALLAQIDQTWSPQAAAKGLRLRVRMCRGAVHSDAMLLGRIAHNLVANAVAYTRRGGVLVACRPRQGGWELQVWDSGPGIASEHQAAVFDEFMRLAAPGEGRQGLGLGLSIVQRSAQVLGHAVRLASRPGRGSCFAVHMAAARTAPLAAPGTVPDAWLSALKGAFVAVVDDDATSREATAALFMAQGCLVVSEAGAAGLLDELERHLRAPDLLLTDWRLGAQDTGQALLLALRARYDLPIPALLVTADTGLEPAAAGAAPGVVVLRKPVSARRLLVAAHELLAGPSGWSRTAAPAEAAAPPAAELPAAAWRPSWP